MSANWIVDGAQIDSIKTGYSGIHISTGCPIYTNISSVVEFQRSWVLESKIFGQESTS